METLIKTTFIIILVFSFINLTVSSLIYFNSKKKLYLRVSLFWLALIVNFIIQSAAQSTETSIIMGYSFALLPLNLLCYASVFFVETKYPWKKFTSLALVSLLTSFYLINFSQVSFFIKALPLSISTAAPLLYIAYLFLLKKRKQCSSIMKCHSLILMALAIHCFNFAIFRNNPSAQLWGWPVSYAIYQLLAAIIPAMSIDFYHKQEQRRLSTIISERTKELNESNQFLKAAVKEKDFLFKTLVHDVSNPLSVILGRIKIYEKNKNIDKFVTTVNTMANRISSLIQQVQSFETAMATNDGEIEVEKINLSKSLSGVFQLFEDKLQKKNIALSYDLQKTDDIFIYSEKKILTNSIIPNIINNAIKFSHNNGTIDIASDADYENSMCTLCISDTGIGIPKTTMEKIFDFEAETTRPGTEGEKGTGYGLPIIKKLADKSGAKLWIESQEETESRPGRTSVFISFKATLPEKCRLIKRSAA